MRSEAFAKSELCQVFDGDFGLALLIGRYEFMKKAIKALHQW